MHEDNNAVIFVLFGATGDLSRRLIAPALYNLFLGNQLPQHFLLLGVGRDEYDETSLADHYRNSAIDAARAGSNGRWDEFASRLRYFHMELNENDAYQRLAQQLDDIEAQWSETSERVFYMATPPQLFATISKSLGRAGLAKQRERAHIVVEKPLGRDLVSFREINNSLRKHFEEQQIFRIDHFLGKETVQNILALRFANPMFEPVWNRRYVDHVAITMAETLGVEHRAGYYDTAGALRDMVQNHLMQLLCLVAMEPPTAYDADDIRNKKMDVMHALRPIDYDQVMQFSARGQYDDGWINGRRVPAYREEPGIAADSGTETYAALKLYVDNWRWQDVPFYLRTGKRLARDVTEISIRFRDVPHRAFPASAGNNFEPARLVIQIQPNPGIVLKFLAKEPGTPLRLQPVQMQFCYQTTFDNPSPEAYETLLRDVMAGDATLSMRADQVEAAWRLLNPVLDVWGASQQLDFPNYLSGTWGPESAELLVARGGHGWLTPTLEQDFCAAATPEAFSHKGD
jgi:glucose-6-phosphate 1-dehydrogenase